jgi:hypothetical protein
VIVAEALGTALVVVLLLALLFLAGGVSYVVILAVVQAVRYARETYRNGSRK